MALTRSARSERDRILRLYEKAVGETCQAILLSGWNKLTPHQRRKNKAVAEAFDLATECLKQALAETSEDSEGSVPDELKARRAALAAGSRRAKTAKPVECEASQSGAKRNAQRTPHD